MNKIFAVIVAVLFAGVAVAAEPPATLSFKTKNGDVAFSHKAHAEKLKGCEACHGKGNTTGGKIAGWSKDKAHGLCKDCHAKGGKGPAKCQECHKKA